MAESPKATDEDPDWTALARVAGGDVDAFGEIVERHQASLVRLCERMLGEAEEARDATQDVFLKAFRKAASFRPDGKVYTWMYRIAVNHCLNRLRRRKVLQILTFSEVARTPADSDEPYELEPADGLPDPAAQLETRQRWQRLQLSIEILPAGQRAVLVLVRFEGLSYRQTAAALGISESAVESRLHRAMKKLTQAKETGFRRVREA